MTKEEQKQKKINAGLEKIKNFYCDYSIQYKDFENNEKLDYPPIAVFKDLPLSKSRYFKLCEKVILKYFLNDCPVLEYIGVVHDFANVSPLAKAQFYIKNDVTDRKTRPRVIDFCKHYNTGTYVIIFGINEEKHQYYIEVVHNGKILSHNYNKMFDEIINSKDLKSKEKELKKFQKIFQYKIEDVIHVQNPDPRLKMFV